LDLSKTALLIIDVQMAFVHRAAAGDARSGPDAEENIARILAAFRAADLKICHVHHHSRVDGSPFTAGLPGAEVQDFAAPRPGEAVYIKHENSAFIETSLEADLRQRDIRHLIMCGATANHCVETSTRMAGNLGFDTYFLTDGVWAYGETGPDGKSHSAEEVHSMTLANLHGEFATVVATEDVLARVHKFESLEHV
jgi:nicotinamidase-related amidase